MLPNEERSWSVVGSLKYKVTRVGSYLNVLGDEAEEFSIDDDSLGSVDVDILKETVEDVQNRGDDESGTLLQHLKRR